MSEIKADLLYTKDHEWLEKTEEELTFKVGITDFAQNSLGDVTFLELPEVGKEFQKGEIFGSVESVKAVSDLFSPVSGKIVKVNENLVDDPTPINSDPYTRAWMIEIKSTNPSDLEALLPSTAYKEIAE